MMNRIAILGLVLLASVFAFSALATVPVHEWSQRFGLAGFDQGNGVATDASGNVFITGLFAGTANFGGANLVSGGGDDIYLAKYDANGVHQWSKRFGGTTTDVGFNVAADPSGNVVVTGNFQGVVNFGGGALMSAGDNDIFVAKFDASGAHLWSKRFGSSAAEQGYGITVDASGNVIIIGTFQNSVNFGGGFLVSAGFSDMYLAKFDANGTHLWSKRFGSTSQDIGRVAATDASGNVIMIGYYANTVDFGGGPLASAGGGDVIVAKYDASGAHQWSKRFGGVAGDAGDDVAVDASGNIVVTGFFGDTVDFGGGPLASAGGIDIFLAKYDASGAHQWSQRFGDASSQEGNGVEVDASGGVVLIGQFVGTTDFGGGNLVSAGDNDIFVARYDSDGVHKWSRRFGFGSYDLGADVVVDPSGGIIITGPFIGTVDFGGGNLVSTSFTQDVFLAKYSEEDPIPVLITAFDATSRGISVDLTWSLWSDEALDHFQVFRQQGTSSPVVVVTGDASVRAYTDRSVEAGKTYAYELIVHTVDGGQFRSPIATVNVARPSVSLGQNVPNPFNPRTTIEYVVDHDAMVSIEIFDAAGRMVARLDEGARSGGTYRAEWDGRDTTGAAAASGVYFYRLAGVRGAETRKMVLLK